MHRSRLRVEPGGPPEGADDYAVIGDAQPPCCAGERHLFRTEAERRRRELSMWLEARSVGLAVRHEVEGVVLETIDRRSGPRARRRRQRSTRPLSRLLVTTVERRACARDEKLVDSRLSSRSWVRRAKCR